MLWLQVKQAGVIALAAVNLALLVWALFTGRKRRSLPGGYYRLLPVSIGIAVFQLSVGLFFIIRGRQPHLQHLFYGALVAIGALLQFLVRPGSATGQRYRHKPLVHAVLALFVALVGIRSWMTG